MIQISDVELLAESIKTYPPENQKQHISKLRKMMHTAMSEGNLILAKKIGAVAKSTRIPCESLDLLRAVVFMQTGDTGSAIEALKEEIRYFPHNKQARDMLQQLVQLSGRPQPCAAKDADFEQLYSQILPYTMVGPDRLLSLYEHALSVCRQGPEGSFVECGVAGGGSSGLLAAVIKKNAPHRRLYSCDSFEGMPKATEHDTHQGTNAEETGWGSGTCAAPESSVLSLCAALHAEDRIEIVKGYFEDTLPVWKQRIGPIAFLHMDGDWYASTRAILENLYDQLVPGAYVQVDDYGYWEGCRKAFHEFMDKRGEEVAVTPIDGTGVWFIKK